MADYTKYSELAPEWLEFQKTFSPPVLPVDIEEAKIVANANRAALFAKSLGEVEEVKSQDVTIPTSDSQTIEARIYHSTRAPPDPRPLYLYLHGGGWHFGNLESEDKHCRLICLNTSTVVVSINYRHTPTWKFPTAVHDIWDALDWIEPRAERFGFDPRKMYAGGVSAGAALCIALSVHELETSRGTGRIKGLVLTVPPTCDESVFPRHLLRDCRVSSFEQNADAPVLNTARFRMFEAMYQAGTDPYSPYASPLLIEDEKLKGFPPTTFQICGADPLRDGGLLFEEKLRKLGVRTRLIVYQGWPHAFMNFPMLKESARWRDRLFEDVRWVMEQGMDST